MRSSHMPARTKFKMRHLRASEKDDASINKREHRPERSAGSFEHSKDLVPIICTIDWEHVRPPRSRWLIFFHVLCISRPDSSSCMAD